MPLVYEFLKNFISIFLCSNAVYSFEFMNLRSYSILLFKETRDQLNKVIVLANTFTSRSCVLSINVSFVADPKSAHFLNYFLFLQTLFQVWESSIERAKTNPKSNDISNQLDKIKKAFNSQSFKATHLVRYSLPIQIQNKFLNEVKNG